MIRQYIDKIKEFSDIIKNFSYSLSYQILSLILPIITIPYITRVFTQENVGILTVSNANCYFFVLFGMLGITLLGPREIAKCLKQKEQLASVFFNIYSIQLLFHIIATFAYIIYCFIGDTNVTIKLFYVLYLVSSMFDINWFFIGIEDFKNVSIRNVCIKLLSFFLLFILVKTDADLYTYICTLFIPQILINIYMWWILLKKNIYFVKPDLSNKYYIKEAISLFVPQVASSVYTVLGRTLLGALSTYTVAAIYTQGQTLLLLAISVVPSFCKIMAPRIASCIKRGDNQEVMKYMKMSSNVIFTLSFFLMFLVCSCANLFTAWYLPPEYEETAIVLIVCSPIIVAVSCANLISVEYLIPLGKQKIYTISVFISCIANLLLCIALIPKLGLYGVCIGNLVAEIIGALIQVLYSRKLIDLSCLFSNVPCYIFSGLIMFFALSKASSLFEPKFSSLFILALLGVILYGVVVLMIFRILRIIKNRYSNG